MPGVVRAAANCRLPALRKRRAGTRRRFGGGCTPAGARPKGGRHVHSRSGLPEGVYCDGAASCLAPLLSSSAPVGVRPGRFVREQFSSIGVMGAPNLRSFGRLKGSMDAGTVSAPTPPALRGFWYWIFFHLFFPIR